VRFFLAPVLALLRFEHGVGEVHGGHKERQRGHNVKKVVCVIAREPLAQLSAYARAYAGHAPVIFVLMDCGMCAKRGVMWSMRKGEGTSMRMPDVWLNDFHHLVRP